MAKKVETTIIGYINQSELDKLTPKEQKYWKIIRSTNNGGAILYVKGKSGIGKSATVSSIAKKLNLLLLDLRLATKDESDLGVLPKVNMADGYEYATSVIPEWAHLAMTATKRKNPDTNNYYSGSLIVFEELNRSSKNVRDAAMGILNERRIGESVKFPMHTYMVATGNLGEEDGTEVEELDAAQKGRSITLIEEPDLSSWLSDFAQISDKKIIYNGKEKNVTNVHPAIISFLKENPSAFYPKQDYEETDVLISPRQWTVLSNYFYSNYNGTDLMPYIDDVESICLKMIPLVYGKFIDHVRKFVKLTLKDILTNNKLNYDEIPRDHIQELIEELKDKKIWNCTLKERKQIKKFLDTCDRDIVVGYITQVFEEVGDDEIAKMPEFVTDYQDKIDIIMKNADLEGLED